MERVLTRLIAATVLFVIVWAGDPLTNLQHCSDEQIVSVLNDLGFDQNSSFVEGTKIAHRGSAETLKGFEIELVELKDQLAQQQNCTVTNPSDIFSVLSTNSRYKLEKSETAIRYPKKKNSDLFGRKLGDCNDSMENCL